MVKFPIFICDVSAVIGMFLHLHRLPIVLVLFTTLASVQPDKLRGDWGRHSWQFLCCRSQWSGYNKGRFETRTHRPIFCKFFLFYFCLFYLYCIKYLYICFKGFYRGHSDLYFLCLYFLLLQLRIRANDNGSPPRSAEAVVKITVRRNFQTPQLNQNSYSFQLKETFPVGNAFLTISATDTDSQVLQTCRELCNNCV